MALSLFDLEDLIRSTGKNFVLSLDTPELRAQATKWTMGMAAAVARGRLTVDQEVRDQARKEVRDFEDAFSLKFGTTELRTAEAATKALYDFGRGLIPVLARAAVTLMV